MGRTSTGVISTNECRRLDMVFMLKNGWIKKGCTITGKMNWTDESNAKIETVYTDKEKYVRMVYTITDRHGTKSYYDYKIKLVTVPSNLGRGEVLYFQCPESHKSARVLYSAYGHPKYLHRDWYKERYGVRVYYQTQQYSKKDYHNTRYHKLDRQIEKLRKELLAKHRKHYYKEKPTKEFLKLKKLIIERDYHDTKRSEILQDYLSKKYYSIG